VDRLLAVADAIAPGGFITATMVYRPHYASTAAPNGHTLLYFDADNLVQLNAAGAIVMRIAGEELATGTITFAALQALTVTFEHSADGRAVTVAGATTGNATVTAAALSPMRLPTHALILGGPTGAELQPDLLMFAPDLTNF
jgi:hypothetical protein